MKRLLRKIKSSFINGSFVGLLILAFVLALNPESITGGSSGNKVQVKGYYRKDGTYVQPYTRRAPGTVATPQPNSNTPGIYSPPSSASTGTPSLTPSTPKCFSVNGQPCKPRDNTPPKITPPPPRPATVTTPPQTPSATSRHNRCATCPSDSQGRIKRSEIAKNDFKKTHPCPANGKRSGPCPGYVIDHIKPLKRGGTDAPSNMQWQTIENAKRKDKIE